jgi:hypothetical protein
MSAAGEYLDPARGGAFDQAPTSASLFVVAALPSCFAWLVFGAGMHVLVRSERSARLFKLSMAVLLVTSVSFIVT